MCATNSLLAPAKLSHDIQGLHHLGLTVSDVATTAKFFTDYLNFKAVGGKPEYPAQFITNGHLFLTLWQTQVSSPVAFDRHKNIGLHHLALNVGTIAVLDELHQLFVALTDVTVEFAPEAMGDSPIQHMICTIPGGLRVEFLAPPSIP